MIKSMNGGTFLSLSRDLAYKALNKLANNSHQWDFFSCQDKSVRNLKKGDIYELKGEAKLNLKIDVVTKRLDTLNISQPINAANTFIVDSCSFCASLIHLAQNCPSMPVLF
jgi:hypothetical protein